MGARVRFLVGALLLACPAACTATTAAPIAPAGLPVSPAPTPPSNRFDLPLSPVSAAGRVVYPINNHYNLHAWDGATFAPDGAFLRNYGSGYGNAGLQFTPVSASALCYTAHRVFVESGDAEARAQVLRQAGALIARAEPAGRGILWPYRFPNRPFGARAGWISGMGQGEAMACLAAAYSVSGDRRYLTAAAKAFAALRAPFGNRGTAAPVGNGVFYEEVAGAGSAPAHILNGMIFALGGIWMLDRIDARPEYARALRDGIAGVRSAIDSYEAAGSSLYDLGPRRVASIGHYNLVHIEQLQWLYSLTGERHFLEVALRLVRFERRLAFDVRSTGMSAPPGANGSFASPPNRAVALDLSLPGAPAVDRIEMIVRSADEIPAEVRLVRDQERVVLRPRTRMISIAVPSRRTASLRLEFVPRPGRRVALALVTVTNPDLRSLATISSDIDAYRDVRSGSRGTANLTDGRTSTQWFTGAADPWLLMSIGEAGYRSVTVASCAEASGFAWRFGAGLDRLGPETAADGNGVRTPIAVPEGARFLVMRWSGRGACLSEVTGLR